MNFLDRLIGVPKRRLKIVTVREMRHITLAAEVQIRGMMAYQDPETAGKLLQSGDFALELAGQICDFVSEHEPIAPMQDYAAVLSPDESSKIELSFRVHQQADAASVGSTLMEAVSEAMQECGVDFVGFR